MSNKLVTAEWIKRDYEKRILANKDVNERVEAALTFNGPFINGSFDEEEFRRQFDPKHQVSQPDEVFERSLPIDAKRFIIVGAQNATPVDEVFWPCLLTAAEDLGAEVLVVPLRYKNATSVWSMSQRNAEYWAKEVQPYLWSKRINLNENLTLVADMKIQPTSSNPLGRVDSMSGLNSAIFAHPKLQMRTVPTPSSRMAKFMTTTGVCTKENYTSSALGKISQFHHSFSAIYVEIVDEKEFHLTQLHFSKVTGAITHFNRWYFPDHAETAPRALALDAGDMHIRFLDPAVEAARAELLDQVNPLWWIFNDTLDSHTNTPHHLGHPIVQQALGAAGKDNVKEEVVEALDYVQAASKKRKVLIVPSNHDDMLTRWVEREDWKYMSDANADFYLELARKMKKKAVFDPRVGVALPDAFTLLAKERKIKNVLALERNESFTLAEVELGMHGDRGPNGSRGSRKNLARIGVKSIIGHSHCPGIEEGCYQTGTSTYLQLEYNHGASGWLNADVLLNADGKRQVVVYVNGRYRAPRS